MRIYLFFLLFLIALYSTHSLFYEKEVYKVHFCPNCTKAFASYLNGQMYCAFFELEHEKIMEKLVNKSNVKILLDNDHMISATNAHPIRSAGYMHHKFCVINNSIVLTGSANPTYNGLERNKNNLVIIYSKRIAHYYKQEWEDLLQKNEKKVYKDVVFCPNKRCEDLIIEQLLAAEKSIDFMVFQMTSKPITAHILHKANKNITITGIIEKKLQSRASTKALLEQYVTIYNHSSDGLLHHKVFIIDNQTVITGSYNPSKNAWSRNDENILIIHNQTIAQAYADEFRRIILQTKKPSVSLS